MSARLIVGGSTGQLRARAGGCGYVRNPDIFPWTFTLYTGPAYFHRYLHV